MRLIAACLLIFLLFQTSSSFAIDCGFESELFIDRLAIDPVSTSDSIQRLVIFREHEGRRLVRFSEFVRESNVANHRVFRDARGRFSVKINEDGSSGFADGQFGDYHIKRDLVCN